MKSIRVFPSVTSATPNDEYCFYDVPPFDEFIPEADEVLVSCTFTWDRARAEFLAHEWERVGLPVKLGGVAYGDGGGEFEPGLFLRRGNVITSRGCIRKCDFCFVPKREGIIRELEIKTGNIIQDNNFLATSKKHQDRVFKMLAAQKSVDFRGGIDVRLLTNEFFRECSYLNLKRLFVAYDSENKRLLNKFKNMVTVFRQQDQRPEIMCYVLVGFENDTPEAAHKRCEDVYNSGVLPFAQYFQSDTDRRNYPAGKWQELVRYWSRPAIYRNHKHRIKQGI